MNKYLRMCGLVLALVLAIPMQFQTADAAVARGKNKIFYGDANADKVVNAEDALTVLNHAAGVEKITARSARLAADVSGDEIINAEDALFILQKSANLIDRFPTMPLSLYIIGDSIAAKHSKDGYERPLYGWGELIGNYYTDELNIVNKAASSMSTRSYFYLKNTYYDDIYDSLLPGDCVIISFGHNDHQSAGIGNVSRRTDPDASSSTKESFKWWLKEYYIDPALEKGATPILMSSVVRCTYKNGVFTETEIHLKYGKAMRDLVAEYAEQGITIHLLDAQQYTYDLYSSIPESQAKEYHGLGQPSWGEWYFDSTHFSKAGATMICEFITSELNKLPLEMNAFLITNAE